MFNNLSSSGHGLFTRIMLLFIVFSFVLWGIGDIFRHGFSDGSVAKVGKASISMQEFQRAVRQRQDEMRSRLGKAYSTELARKLGVERTALEGIINRVLLEQEAAEMGLVVGDDDIVDAIARNPGFQDNTGKFSKDVYQSVLQSNRMSEQGYIDGMKQQMATRMLLDTIAGGVSAPEELVQAVYRARNEKRAVSLLLLPAGGVKPEEPSEKDVQAYYEAHTHNYMVPEYRTLSYLELKPEDVQASVNVSDAEIQKAYHDRSEEFQVPERRAMEQMIFEKQEDADKAYAALTAGKALAEVAGTLPVLNKDKLQLGELTKQTIPVAADEVFALKEGGISKPAESGFGWHVMRVAKILPPSQRPLSEVREQLAKDIRANAVEDAVAKRSGGIEDALGGGATLEEAAQKAGVKLQTLAALTRDGIDAHGAKVTLPAYANFIDTAFSTAEKDHSRMMQGENGVYFMVRVDSVQKEHAKPLAEVKALVLDALHKEKADSALRALADQVAKDLKSGKKPEEALAGKGLTVAYEAIGSLLSSAETVESGRLKGKALPEGLVKELFTLKTAATTGAYALPEGGYVIGRLDQVTSVPQDSPALAKDSAALRPVREELKQALDGEMRSQYLQYLRQKHPVTIKHNFSAASVVGDDAGGE